MGDPLFSRFRSGASALADRSASQGSTTVPDVREPAGGTGSRDGSQAQTPGDVGVVAVGVGVGALLWGAGQATVGAVRAVGAVAGVAGTVVEAAGTVAEVTGTVVEAAGTVAEVTGTVVEAAGTVVDVVAGVLDAL
jgi:hypothetical protein